MPSDQGNRQSCHPVGDRRVATARLAGKRTDGRGSQAVASRASAIGGCRACTGCMSAMREELHHLADLLPRPDCGQPPGLIRAHAAGDHGPETDLPFASVEAGPDLAGRTEQISPPDPAAEVLLCDTGVLLAAGNVKDHARQACLRLLRHADGPLRCGRRRDRAAIALLPCRCLCESRRIRGSPGAKRALMCV